MECGKDGHTAYEDSANLGYVLCSLKDAFSKKIELVHVVMNRCPLI